MPYKTREQALAVASSIGCPIGAHKTEDGQWMPCRSDEAFMQAKGNSTKKQDGEPFEITAEVMKVDDSLGLVFCWAIICKEQGKPYFDLQNDYIPEESMLKAMTEFMANSRAVKDMHKGEQMGHVLFAFPLTEEVAKAFELQTMRTGAMIALKPDSEEILEKYRSGEYTGVSIGGIRLQDEDVN